MKERYFVLIGNEAGAHVDDAIRLISLEQAEEDYISLLEAYGCASLHEVKEDIIIRIKSTSQF